MSLAAQNFDMARIRRGRFGAGLYFSERSEVAAGYTTNALKKVLLCKLLIGCVPIYLSMESDRATIYLPVITKLAVFLPGSGLSRACLGKPSLITQNSPNKSPLISICPFCFLQSHRREYRIGGASPSGPAPGRDSALVDGYDSHLVNDGEMVVIFDSDQCLPCYVVHYE